MQKVPCHQHAEQFIGLAVNTLDLQHTLCKAELIPQGGEATVSHLDGIAYKVFERKEDFENELTVLRATRHRAAHHSNIVELVI